MTHGDLVAYYRPVKNELSHSRNDDDAVNQQEGASESSPYQFEGRVASYASNAVGSLFCEAVKYPSDQSIDRLLAQLREELGDRSLINQVDRGASAHDGNG